MTDLSALPRFTEETYRAFVVYLNLINFVSDHPVWHERKTSFVRWHWEYLGIHNIASAVHSANNIFFNAEHEDECAGEWEAYKEFLEIYENTTTK